MYEFFIGVIIYVALVCFFLYFCIKYEKQQTEEDIVVEPKNDLEKQVQHSFLKMSETERARVLEKVLKKNISENISQSSLCQQSDDVSIIIRNKKIKNLVYKYMRRYLFYKIKKSSIFAFTKILMSKDSWKLEMISL